MAEHRPVWTTRDGKKIPVDEMSDQHLENATAMVRRKKATAEIEAEAAFSLGATAGGDEASRQAELAMSRAADDANLLSRVLNVLEHERDRRAKH